MKKIQTLILLASLSLASCMTVSQEAATSTPPALISFSPPPTTTDVLPTGKPGTPGTGQRAYYVSPTGNNSDGKSWASAWNGLDQVNSRVIQPGDTIYLSGGISGVTYPGGIRVSRSGTASAYITIDSGANSPSPAGHNGTVIIEGGRNCIRARGSYLKIRNLLCQHATDSGFRIQGEGIILENNTIRETYGQGIHLQYCTGCIIRGNRISTFPNDGPGENRPYQTDGIVAYESSDTLIERNWIKLTNQYGPAHIDGIQASTQLGANYENITIQYNYVENTKNMASDSQGIYLTQVQGTIRIIGNVVNHPMGPQSVTSHLANTVGSPANVFIVGNTIKCGAQRCLMVGDNASPVIKNNIIWQTGIGQLTDLTNVTDCNPANINNNLYYAPNSSYPFTGNCGRTWSQWHDNQRLDATGIFGQNPNLDNCFRPTNGSPSTGKGAILADEYNQGLSLSLCGQNGPDTFLPVILQNRNQHGGASWDIGAYELP